MLYCSVPLDYVSLPLGKGGRVYNAAELSECQLASLFKKVYIDGKKVDYPFLMVLIKEESESHAGRKTIKYSDKIAYQNGNAQYSNHIFIQHLRKTLGISDDACWFVHSMEICNQDELHMYSIVVDVNKSVSYPDSVTRRNHWLELLKADSKYTITPEQDETQYPLQQIFFGAPGTGKSFEVDEMCKSHIHYRTTFHPDSDYSTFVGCYKPTMKTPNKLYTIEELTVKLKEIKNSGTPYPCHKFSAKYWKSLKDLSAESIKKILSACGFTEAYSVEVSKGVAIGQEYMDRHDEKIVYSFTPQAFTNAYIKAWQTKEPVFLIIEEINRGNCAQIFGDLFQLLDRDEKGFSRYEISPDTDLQKYISEIGLDISGVVDHEGNDISALIASGELLKLPNNLYIWATMNTSDQSLFPIDSAFKRRWDWKYMPINNAEKGHIIALSDRQYDWWEFLDAVNKRIEKVTESEDKQLGYWFAKPENGGEISADKFVAKVVFYLWNDVFKDYGHDANSPFVIKKDDGKKIELRYKSFFDKNGDVEEKTLVLFFWGLKLQTKAGATAISESSSENSDKDENNSAENGMQENVATDFFVDDTEEPVFDKEDELPEATSIDDFFK